VNVKKSDPVALGRFHHYWLAWIASLFCPFDHPASVFCLAATTGIFCQGVAAYGTAEIFTKGSS
jgi:hypothetical protein